MPVTNLPNSRSRTHRLTPCLLTPYSHGGAPVGVEVDLGGVPPSSGVPPSKVNAVFERHRVSIASRCSSVSRASVIGSVRVG